jgi:hypothetical protein
MPDLSGKSGKTVILWLFMGTGGPVNPGRNIGVG